MRFIKYLFLIAALMISPGCAYFDGLGYFHHDEELVEAKIEFNRWTKYGSVFATSPDGLLCTGSVRTKKAPESYWSCMGTEGIMFMSCNDGRHLMAKWSADTCSSGQAIGGDQYGNTFVFSFGENRDEMLRRIGAGPETPRAAYTDEPASPLYGSMLGFEGEGTVAMYSAPRGTGTSQPEAKEISGFFVTDDGYIIAALKDKLPARPGFRVELNDGSSHNAMLVKHDPQTGLVLLKTRIQASPLPLAGDSALEEDKNYMLGPSVVGSPFVNKNWQVAGVLTKIGEIGVNEVKRAVLGDLPLSSTSKPGIDSAAELMERYSSSLVKITVNNRPKAKTGHYKQSFTK